MRSASAIDSVFMPCTEAITCPPQIITYAERIEDKDSTIMQAL